MSGHPHPGKRSKWIACKTQPDMPGWYETKILVHVMVMFWNGKFWSHYNRGQAILFGWPRDKWRGLAEKPE